MSFGSISITSLIQTLLSFIGFLKAIFVLWGLYMVYSVLVSIVKTTNRGMPVNYGGIAIQLLIAGAITYSPWVLETLGNTLTGGVHVDSVQAIKDVVGYASASTAEIVNIDNFVKFIYLLLLVSGYIAVIRGLHMFYLMNSSDSSMSAVDRSKMTSSAIWHIIGGELLLNFGYFLNVIQDHLK